jgi:cellulose synthase/poly-beta-1,6-N-acetylglucosamine synthase-like glycosyltransferase
VIALLALKSLLVGRHSRRLHYAHCRPYRPRITVLVPAWNEAAVLGTAIDRLLHLGYPAGRLRIIVVDDASTAGTAAVAGAKVAEYPDARWEKTEKTGQAVSPV